MASNTREIRTTRIEDWEGNIYKPEGVGSSGGTGGQSAGSDDVTEGGSSSGALNYTEGTHITDNNATDGTSIILTSDSSVNRVIVSATFDDVEFGRHSVVVRVKSSVANSDAVILKINTYYVDNTEANPTVLLETWNVKAKHFYGADVYSEVGFVTDFKGVKTTSISLCVEVIVVAGTGAAITFDNIRIMKESQFDTELNSDSVNAPQTKIVSQKFTQIDQNIDNIEKSITNINSNITNMSKTLGDHKHPANQITAGTLAGKVVANASAVASLGTKQVRNIHAGTAAITSLPAGDIYIRF